MQGGQKPPKRTEFTSDLLVLDEHMVTRHSQTSQTRPSRSVAMRQIILCSSARSITAATMPSFLGRGATTPLADPLRNIRSPIQTGDSCGLAYCISDQLGGDTLPISTYPGPTSSMRTARAKRTQKTQLFRIPPTATLLDTFRKQRQTPSPYNDQSSSSRAHNTWQILRNSTNPRFYLSALRDIFAQHDHIVG